MKSHPIIICLLVIVLAYSFAEAKYSGGTGEPSDPYRIATAEDLNDIGNHQEDWDNHFVLVNDVNIAQYTGTQFKIIGRANPDYKPFTGVFDGNDHKIWNFMWRSTDGNCIGLFRYVEEPAQIKNLGLENVDVNVINGMYVGGLVGYNSGTITKCYSSGVISGDREVGGLVGENGGGTITSCYSSTKILGSVYVGGLLGFNCFYSTICDCYTVGNVSGDDIYIGGLVGGNEGTIISCYSSGSVSGDAGGDCVGGLVGSHYYDTMIRNCYSTSSVTGHYAVGGLAGEIQYGVITGCYSTGSVSGYWWVGGLVGDNWFGTINDCFSTGAVLGDQDVGGLVGDNFGSITDCFSAAAVTGNKGTGGLVGYNEEEGTINNCYSTGRVLGTIHVGGLVGRNPHSIITNCYSTGSVSGITYVGGLVGYNQYGNILNCYSTGTVTGSSSIGGLVGVNYYGGVHSSFWDVEISDCNSSAGGIGKTTTEMKTKSTFTNAGWDFTNIWDICEGTNYPRFVWQVPAADWVCPDGVGFEDFSYLADSWQIEFGISDLAILCEQWLEGR